jgi:non-canonical poly(A) RNA polymerase PAPD5/7
MSGSHSSDMFDSNEEEETDDDEHNDDDARNEGDNDQEEESWKDADFLRFSGASSKRAAASTAAGASRASSDDDDDDDDDDDEDDDIEVNLDAPWMNGHTMLTSVNHLNRIHPLVRLHNEIVWFVRLIEPTVEEIRARERLVQRVRALVQKTFENGSSVEVFGSQATNLFLPTSDIDIVVYTKPLETSNNNANESKTNESQQGGAVAAANNNPLHVFADALRHEWGDDELSYLDIIENTKVPLVKFTHASTNVCVDVCFDQATGPPAAQLMTTYLDALPPLRPLTFCLKQFLQARGLNEPYSGGVGSFLLQLMIVSFL